MVRSRKMDLTKPSCYICDSAGTRMVALLFNTHALSVTIIVRELTKNSFIPYQAIAAVSSPFTLHVQSQTPEAKEDSSWPGQ